MERWKKRKKNNDYEDIDEFVLIWTLPSLLPKYALEIIFMNKPVSTTPVYYNETVRNNI
jgi:hypothetical protein